MRIRFVVIALAAGALLIPASASAAIVERELINSTGPHDTDQSYYRARMRAADGEVNRVAVTREGDAVVLTDLGAPLDSGAGCEQVTASRVRCAGEGRYRVESVSVDAGDGDDRVDVLVDLSASVSGGPGDDVLTGGSDSTAWLTGGDGRDVLTDQGSRSSALYGGAGPDVLRGGAGGNDLVGDGDGAAPADDVIDGGGGNDRVLYSERTEPIAIDLAVGRGGQPGESDSLTSVENATGGAGPDAISGDAGPNFLDGRDSSSRRGQPGDRISGRGGNDVITATAGADVLRGGDGSDGFDGRGGPDLIDAGAGNDRLLLDGRVRGRRTICGSGDDDVFDTSTLDVIRADCERIGVDDLLTISLKRSRGGLAVVALSDDPSAFPPCQSNLTLSRRGERVGRAILRRLSRRPKTVRFRLTPFGRRLLARRGRLRVDLRSVSYVDCPGVRMPFRPLRGGFVAEV